MTAETSLDVLYAHLAEAASVLSNSALSAAIEDLRQYGAEGTTRVLVVGRIGSGRASVINALLHRPDLLPISPVPRTAVPITVRVGPAEQIEVTGSDGLRQTVSPSQLRLLLGPRADVHAPGARPASVDIALPDPALAGLEFRLETLTGDGQAASRLPTAGFVLLVLNATALLSQVERDFIREHLLPLGLSRVAVVVNGLDRVDEEERAGVVEAVQTFLGAYGEHAAVVPLSARDALAALRTASSAPALAALDTLLADITLSGPQLRLAAFRHALTELGGDLERSITARRSDLRTDRARLEAMRASLAAARETIERRTARVRQRTQTFFTLLIKERLRKELQSFTTMLSRRLPDDIRTVGDPFLVRRHLPNYLQYTWTAFLSRLSLSIERELQDEAAVLERMVTEDIRELLGEAAELEGVVLAVESLTGVVRPVMMPRRGKHAMSGLLRSLNLHGFLVMILFRPYLGALSLATSYVLRRLFAAGIERTEIEALIGAAQTAVTELSAELDRRIDAEFSLLATDLTGEIEAIYRRVLDRAGEEIDRLAAEGSDVEERARELNRIERLTLGALRQRISEMAAGPA